MSMYPPVFPTTINWDAFAAAAIRTVGVDDLLANAAPDGDAP